MDALHNPRYWMWCRILGEDYKRAGHNKKIKIKRDYMATWGTYEREPNEEDKLKAMHFAKGDTISMDDVDRFKSASKDIVRKYDSWSEYVAGAYPPEMVGHRSKLEESTQRTLNRLASDNMVVRRANGFSWFTTEEEKQKEENMYTQVTVDSESEGRKAQYLSNRMNEVYHEKRNDGMAHFHMDDNQRPKSPKEMVERIKAGDFKFDTESTKEDGSWKSKYGMCSASSGIDWNTIPPDEDGYKAFRDKLDAAKEKALDRIRVLTPAEGLATLEEFQAATFH